MLMTSFNFLAAGLCVWLSTLHYQWGFESPNARDFMWSGCFLTIGLMNAMSGFAGLFE